MIFCIHDTDLLSMCMKKFDTEKKGGKKRMQLTVHSLCEHLVFWCVCEGGVRGDQINRT